MTVGLVRIVVVPSIIKKIYNIVVSGIFLILILLLLLTIILYKDQHRISIRAMDSFLEICSPEMTEIQIIESYRTYLLSNTYTYLTLIPTEEGLYIETPRRTITGYFYRAYFIFDSSGCTISKSMENKLCVPKSF